MSWKTKNCYAGDVLKTSWRHVLKTSSKDVWKICWGHAFKTSSRDVLKICWGHVFKTSWRHYGDKQNIYWGFLYLKNISQIYIWQFYVFQDVLKTSWRYLAMHLEYVFKTSWKTKNFYTGDVFKMSSRHVFKTSWRCLEDMSWRHYGDKKNTYWRYLYVANLNLCLANLYFTNLYLTILRQIQNALIKTQKFQYSSHFGTQAAPLF